MTIPNGVIPREFSDMIKRFPAHPVSKFSSTEIAYVVQLIRVGSHKLVKVYGTMYLVTVLNTTFEKFYSHPVETLPHFWDAKTMADLRKFI